MSDSATNFDAARRVMVASQLRPQGVTDARVLAAMAAVPREDHVPAGQQALGLWRSAAPARRRLADDAAGRTRPACSTRLAPRPGERALVVGGGGGYAAALLRHIGLDVDTVRGWRRLARST